MNLTKEQLYKATKKHEYLLLRGQFGTMAINCKIADVLYKRSVLKPKDKTQVQSFKPVSFIEYIQLKSPFIIK